ncbi:antirestriction protein ArdA [Corynebacterium qintianiae]|uniref:antirestriction protein ArdA n=1 Tax=Corynebacterium qintianiae TaxID=2709392 RepID=UPI0039A5A022
MSPSEAQAWGEACGELGADHLWPAYCAWISSGVNSEDADGVGSVTDFIDSFAGEWSRFSKFACDYIENSGMLDGAPEIIARYFDYQTYSRDSRARLHHCQRSTEWRLRLPELLTHSN